ncbi:MULTISPECIES: LuxR C-terminal-related transcriptional regulator [unclassified Streptomyces]|uniref:helix-turn-helix transcriptional regulator n=1 Tax=unclassified Streptomyces TaxID=2593676 RepID=UPI00381D355A
MTTDSPLVPLDRPQENEDLAELYQLASRMQVLRVRDGAERLGWSAARVIDAARRLGESGLLQPLQGEEPAYVAVAPRAAASRLLAPLHSQIARIERRSEEIRAELATFQQVHDQALRETEHEQAFRTLSGVQAISDELALASAKCRHELLSAQPGGGAAGGPWRLWEPDVAVVARGVRVRAVFQHTARFSRPAKEFLTAMSRCGGEVRTLGDIFERMTVFDREVAFIPVPDCAERAVVIRQPGVVQFLTGVFDRSWLTARPFESHNRATEVSQLVSGVRMSILRLLAEGETDDAIARQVGLSVRTCRSHIAKVYQEFGARSRFHLGVLIAGSGLLDEERAAC